MMYKFSPLMKQYAIVIAVNLTTLCVGMDLGWTSPVLVKLQDPAQTPLSRPITEDEAGWIVSIGYIISILMLPCVGLLVDCIGRKNSILLISMPKIIGSLLTIFASEVWMLLVARAINLTINNAAMTIVMIYCSEIASKEVRGSLGSLLPLFCSLGVFIMLSIGPYVSYLILTILVTVITVGAWVLLLFIPDTPYSLYNKGKIEEAKKVLTFVRGTTNLAEDDLKELSQTKPNEKFDKREIFKNKAYIKALVIVVVMGVGVQVVGFNFISFYLQTILESTKTTVSSALGSLIIGLIQIIASVSAGVASDRFGRKSIMVATLLGMAVGMIGLGIFFVFQQQGALIRGFLNYLPITSIALVTCCFGGGIGSQFFVIITELLDDKTRALGSSLSMFATTIVIFLLSRYTLAILSALGSATTFIAFGFICIAMSLFVLFVVPETKHKSIAEIQRSLGGLKANEERDSKSQC